MYDPAPKFNRCRISIHFAFPARRDTATAHALLPLVLERGYADCPDMTQLSKKLARLYCADLTVDARPMGCNHNLCVSVTGIKDVFALEQEPLTQEYTDLALGVAARLYGADLTVDARPMGCNHNLCVSVTGIKDVFALEQEPLTQEYTDLALGVAFRPYLVEGSFDPEAVAIEKQMLKKALEDELNDKQLYCQRQASRAFFGDSPAGVRQEGYLEEVDIEKQMLKKALEDELNDKQLYCQRQASRAFFGDSPAGVRQEGYLEEVDGITGAYLLSAYQQMLSAAQIELVVLGCTQEQCAQVQTALLEQLSRVQRAPQPLEPSIAMPPEQTPRQLTQYFDTVQAKLCMLFTLGRPMQPQELAAMRLAIALYGGSATSRLFLRVREAQHLCYYCSSSFQSFTGCMAVNSGVEHADALRAQQAVLAELEGLCTGPIEAEELEDCRRGILSAMDGVEDTLGGLENWYYMEILRGEPMQTPSQARADLCSVQADQVRQLLRQFTLSVSCLLTKEGVSVHE